MKDKKLDRFCIAGREIGPECPPYIIAEMSGNHNGDLARSLALMEAAADAGADAVKLQTYTADTLTIDCDRTDFIISGGLWDGRKLYDLYGEAFTPWEWHEALFAKGKELGITVFSTPFDKTAVTFLEGLQAPAHKIASFEMIDTPLVRAVAQTGKPIIMSTGMANFAEIEEAVDTVRQHSDAPLVLLHCVSAYPAPANQANLRMIEELSRRYNVLTGLSDHTLGTSVAIAAVACGARVIEKHFTLSRAEGGPDAAFSLEPHELRELVIGCRTAFEAIGNIADGQTAAEKGSLTFRRSIYVVKDMEAGELFSPENVRIIRPGYGLAPKYYDNVLGKRAKVALRRGDALKREMIDE